MYAEIAGRYDRFHGAFGTYNPYEQVYLRDDQERLLQAAGFASVAFYGGYRFEPYDKQTSHLLIAVAAKLGGGAL